jgi:transcriptional regulator with XRE-family HTH domain
MLAKHTDLPHALFAKRLLSILVSAGSSTSPKSIRHELLRANPQLRITEASVSHWLSGRAMPRSHNIQALANWLKVAPSFLVYGENDSKDKPLCVGELDLTLEASRLLEAYMALRPQHRHSVLEVIKALIHLQQVEYPNRPTSS